MQRQNPWRGGLQFIRAEARSVGRKRADFAESGITLKRLNIGGGYPATRMSKVVASNSEFLDLIFLAAHGADPA